MSSMTLPPACLAACQSFQPLLVSFQLLLLLLPLPLPLMLLLLKQLEVWVLLLLMLSSGPVALQRSEVSLSHQASCR